MTDKSYHQLGIDRETGKAIREEIKSPCPQEKRCFIVGCKNKVTVTRQDIRCSCLEHLELLDELKSSDFNEGIAEGRRLCLEEVFGILERNGYKNWRAWILAELSKLDIEPIKLVTEGLNEINKKSLRGKVWRK